MKRVTTTSASYVSLIGLLQFCSIVLEYKKLPKCYGVLTLGTTLFGTGNFRKFKLQCMGPISHILIITVRAVWSGFECRKIHFPLVF